jgi:salicylate hydroxylase
VNSPPKQGPDLTAVERERQPVVVAGAGIGGLTAALSLAAGGFSVVVAERATEVSEVGAGVQIGPNAGRVLAGLGLDGAMADAGIEPDAIDILNGMTGGRITSVPGAAFRARYGFPYRVIHRADLQGLLLAAVNRVPAVDLRLGTVVEGSRQRGDEFLVHLERDDQREDIPATALIAADGVWSQQRQAIPRSAAPKPIGRTAWRALIPAPLASAIAERRRVGLWLGPNAHLVHYPVARGSMVNVVAVVEEAWDRPGWNVPGQAAEIRTHFAHWSEAARRLIAAPASWHKYALAPLDPAGPWIDGRTALLGDAAHAMVPFLAQGAAMAIEDAAVLAASLTGTADIPKGLRAYEVARKPRVARVWQAALQTGNTYHFGSLTGAVRNAALAIAGERLVLGRTDWIYRWTPPEPAGSAILAASAGR